MGFFCLDNDYNILLVTAYHVLSRPNLKIYKGDYITYPSPHDIREYYPSEGIEKFIIGVVYDWIKIKFEPIHGIFPLTLFRHYNIGDVAVGKIISSIKLENKLIDTDKEVVGFSKDYHIGDIVYKDGRTSGLTKGVILSTNWSGWVYYGFKKAYMVNQILTRLDIRQGDSGSPLINEDYEIIGLCYAGTNNLCIATPAEVIIRELGIKQLLK